MPLDPVDDVRVVHVEEPPDLRVGLPKLAHQVHRLLPGMGDSVGSGSAHQLAHQDAATLADVLRNLPHGGPDRDENLTLPQRQELDLLYSTHFQALPVCICHIVTLETP